MAINELRSIATFVRTVELGSLSKAAEAQGISPEAASEAPGQLERHLGVRLFHRTTRSRARTEEGRHLFDAGQPPLVGLQQALHGVRQTHEDLAGPLRIVGPRSVLQTAIGPVLQECRTDHLRLYLYDGSRTAQPAGRLGRPARGESIFCGKVRPPPG